MRGKKKRIEYALKKYAIAFHAYEENHLIDSLNVLEEVLGIFKRLEEYEYFAKCMNLLGVIYASIGNSTMSLDCYLDALTCAQEHELIYVKYVCYNNIGARYQELGEHEKAMQYFEMTMEKMEDWYPQRKERHLAIKLFIVLKMNMAYSLYYLNQCEEAKNHLLKAIEQMKQHHLNCLSFAQLYLRAKIEWKNGNREYAYEHLSEMIECAKEVHEPSDYINDISELTSLLEKMKAYDCWREVLEYAEIFATSQNSSFLKKAVIEMKLQYAKVTQQRGLQQKLCVQYVNLLEKLKEESQKERIRSMDVKLALRELEVERTKALRENQILQMRSKKDALTGLENRYQLSEHGNRLIRKAYKEKRIIAIGIMDIDYFKEYNDTYGHIAGDKCLAHVAEVLKEVMESGMTVRYGGDEFVVVQYEDPTEEQMKKRANMIQRRVRELHIEHQNSKVSKQVTLSQGYILVVPQAEDTLETLLEEADSLLYQVKKEARNGYLVCDLTAQRRIFSRKVK